MKCNKCLKTIPKGEEIRFSSKTFRSSNFYSGYYCEDCWKNSEYCEFHEEKTNNKNNSNSSIPTWAWIMMISGWVLFGLMLLWQILRILRDEND